MKASSKRQSNVDYIEIDSTFIVLKANGMIDGPSPAHVTRLKSSWNLNVGFVPKRPTNAELPNFPSTTTEDSRKGQPKRHNRRQMFGKSGSQTPWRFHQHSWLEDYWWKDTRMNKRKAVFMVLRCEEASGLSAAPRRRAFREKVVVRMAHRRIVKIQNLTNGKKRRTIYYPFEKII